MISEKVCQSGQRNCIWFDELHNQCEQKTLSKDLKSLKYVCFIYYPNIFPDGWIEYDGIEFSFTQIVTN